MKIGGGGKRVKVVYIQYTDRLSAGGTNRPMYML